jgi:hypothetical protein
MKKQNKHEEQKKRGIRFWNAKKKTQQKEDK